MLNFKRFNAVV